MSPKSGRSYAGFVEAASADRMVFAHDYPGFGESDPPPAEPHVTIEDYAESLYEVADQLGVDQFDVMGYHTGCMVAAEAARQHPDRIGHLILISAPVFTAAELEALHNKYQAIPLDEQGTRFQHMWEAVVAHRGPGMTLEMMAASFAENLRPGEAYEWGHRAAFNYGPQFLDVVASLNHRITVINPGDDLYKETPRIEPALNNGTIIDKPEWGHGFLDVFTDDVVELVRRILGSE